MLERSSAREFGHARTGYAVEFNIPACACRSLTVETREEAKALREMIEAEDITSNVRVVRDE